MEHDELDEIFKNIIQNDKSPLNQKELEAKERTWDALEPQKRIIPFPFWRIASAILFLLLIGNTVYFSQKIDNQHKKYLAIESNYNNLLLSNASLRAEVDKKNEPKVETPFSKPKNNKTIFENPITKSIKPQVIYLKDTVWIANDTVRERDKIVIRDTVFIELPAPNPHFFVENEKELNVELDTLTQHKKPSKIKFVFAKKEIKKVTPIYKYLRINENEIVRKNDSSKSGIITIPIKN